MPVSEFARKSCSLGPSQVTRPAVMVIGAKAAIARARALAKPDCLLFGDGAENFENRPFHVSMGEGGMGGSHCAADPSPC